MPISKAEGKNKKLIFISLGILFLIASLFALKILFFSKQGIADSNSTQSPIVANAENIKTTRLVIDMFSGQKFKDMNIYPFKITDVEDIKKGNKSPFGYDKEKTGKTGLDSAAIDKLFKEFTTAFGVELDEEEKAKCLEGIADRNLTSEGYHKHVNSCFTDKRNKLLM